MNNTTRDTSKALPEAILEEAAIWQARLLETDPDTDAGQELRKRFHAWLGEDPRHQHAYEEMESLWGALAAPVAKLVEEESNACSSTAASPIRAEGRSVARPFQRLALAASLVAAIASAIGWQQDWGTRWQSDHVTAIGEQAPVLLDDNSRITLSTDSALAVNFTSRQRQVRLFKGEAWFEVAPDEKRPFIVASGAGSVRVTGTRFNVRLEGESAIVSLDEGKVELRIPSTPDHAPTVLAPGQQAILAQSISTPAPFDRTAVTAWLRGQFVFYNTPLADVVDTLNRYRPGRILIANDELNSLQVSGIFSTDDPDAALDLITNTLPIHQTRLTDYLVLLR